MPQTGTKTKCTFLIINHAITLYKKVICHILHVRQVRELRYPKKVVLKVWSPEQLSGWSPAICILRSFPTDSDVYHHHHHHYIIIILLNIYTQHSKKEKRMNLGFLGSSEKGIKNSVNFLDICTFPTFIIMF